MRPILHGLLQAVRRPRTHALGLALAALMLSACGGGDASGSAGLAPVPQSQAKALETAGAPVSEQATGAPATTSKAAATSEDDLVEADVTAEAPDAPSVIPDSVPGLVAGPVQTVDTGPAGSRVVRAVGALAGGGHAVVWAAPLPDSPTAAWTLWVQAFDPLGAKVGAAAMLDVGSELQDPRNASALVRPEGEVAVGWLGERMTGPIDIQTTVYTAMFALDGHAKFGPKTLDTHLFGGFLPRADRLGGPIAMALGTDGSYLQGWRYVPGSYLGRQPEFRIVRLAADVEPLGWLQHLPHRDLPGDLRSLDRLRLTTLDEGGWVASFPDTVIEGDVLRVVGRVVQNDVARPLGVPEPGTLAPGAWVLDLRRHGSVLFADRFGATPDTPVAPFSMHFNRLGVEQDPVRPIRAIPTTAAALRGGDYVAMWSTGPTSFDAQRYGPRGRPVGAPFTLRATPDVEVAGLRRGGMVLAWVETDATSSRVLTQRLEEPVMP